VTGLRLWQLVVLAVASTSCAMFESGKGLGERCGAVVNCGEGLVCGGSRPPTCMVAPGRCVADTDCGQGEACRKDTARAVGRCERRGAP
jgi:hypothetical protein